MKNNCRDEYFRMKLQWKTFSQEQLQNFTQLRERQALIGSIADQLVISQNGKGAGRVVSEKDVIRTDRSDAFFKGSLDNNVNLCKLYDILMTYCMFNFDLGGFLTHTHYHTQFFQLMPFIFDLFRLN